jgi:hypothetical protein
MEFVLLQNPAGIVHSLGSPDSPATGILPMSSASTFLLGCWLLAAPAPDLAQALSGSWWINGNGTYGELIIEVVDGEITGTIYEQPIVGTFDASTGRVTFVRKLDVQDAQGVQEWTGDCTHVAGSLPPQYSLSGTFKAISDAAFGKLGVDYEWGGSVVRLLPPAEDLKNLQGLWEVSHITPCVREDVVLPNELGLNDVASQVEFDGNALRFNGEHVATLANDVAVQALVDGVGFPSHRLLVLTLPNGQGLVCSYVITESGVEIAYPHTTACHRGSGHVVFLKRPRS